MGTWGVGTFENDGASDFVYEVQAAPVVATLRRALDEVAGVVASGDYLEAPLCENACAAAEFIAALHNRDASALSPSAAEVFPHITGRPSADDLDRARAVVERIMRDSELAALFAESDAYENWLAAMTGLRARLG